MIHITKKALLYDGVSVENKNEHAFKILKFHTRN